MVDGDTDPVQCVGYAGFLAQDQPGFRQWFARLESDIAEVATGPNRRLIELQHALVDLVRELDPKAIRYPDDVLAKI